jgi:hypothetical protein
VDDLLVDLAAACVICGREGTAHGRGLDELGAGSNNGRNLDRRHRIGLLAAVGG